VLFPAFLALVFGGVQAAEWYHARSLCLAAADAAVRAARPAGADLGQGRAAAEALLAGAGGGSVSQVTVSTAGSNAAVVRVQVTGTAPRVLPIPGLTMRVSQSMQAPREVFTVDGAP
jgi:Flp pilus assembly protein TadG